jgi:hypothetical protein
VVTLYMVCQMTSEKNDLFWSCFIGPVSGHTIYRQE